jgi:hypothetical protein
MGNVSRMCALIAQICVVPYVLPVTCIFLTNAVQAFNIVQEVFIEEMLSSLPNPSKCHGWSMSKPLPAEQALLLTIYGA